MESTLNSHYHVDTYRAGYLADLGFNRKIGSDYDMEAYTDFYFGQIPNAAWDPDRERIIFWPALALSDKIIYHEFNHGVTYYLNGGITSSFDEEGAISEGNADYFAGAKTGRSLIGDWYIRAYPSYADPDGDDNDVRRDMSNPIIATYTDYLNRNPGPHDGGEFWSAVLWDLRNDPGISTAQADHLVYASIARVDGNPTFAEYRSAMIAEDQAVYGGTHVCTIKNVFASRGIGTPGFTAYINGPGVVNPGETNTWTAVTSCASGTVTYQWDYQPEGSSTWYSLGTSQNVTTSFWDPVYLRIQATSGGQIATSTMYVYVNPDGCSEILCNQESETDITLFDTKVHKPGVPEAYQIFGNYPNPFNHVTEIRYGLPEEAQVRLVIFDMMGREVSRLVEERQAAGYHIARWQAEGMPSGVYLYRLEANGFVATGRLVLLK
ncbi:M36 family metallopeptidase [Rhodocaloribacter litoris]|uniref:M36 family metallopeptidase n=1 Tax=Rhodocaloribacter litoris TaxID=2558931 RepID=UPI001422D6CC|nr:M36 family metallopeptidase [Rhodocaloribacter litoris]QXD16889.1 M36 family metallopeptidase [Rhodocaloribacter litoris]